MKRPTNTTILLAVVSVLLGLNLLAVHEPKAHAQTAGPATGACVRLAGDCVITTVNNCLIQFGAWYGEGTTCNAAEPCDSRPINACPPVSQACCLPDGSCAVLTNALCVDADGLPQPVGVYCTDMPCPLTCNADLDGSGAVGIVDFLQLLAEWGPCE
jgi:hypothetical protein